MPHLHSVFTLPHALNPLIAANRTLLLGELFGTVNWVLQHFAADPQWKLRGVLGFIAVLHTWTQLLTAHYHLHCLVPGGAWRAASKPPGEDERAASKPPGEDGRAASKPPGEDGRAASKPPGEDGNEAEGTWRSSHGRYLFGKDPLAACFRGRFTRRLESLQRGGKLKFAGQAWRSPNRPPGPRN